MSDMEPPWCYVCGMAEEHKVCEYRFALTLISHSYSIAEARAIAFEALNGGIVRAAEYDG